METTGDDRRARLRELLAQAEAGHQAEVASSDPDWPLWYAEFLAPKLRALTCVELSRAELVAVLVHIDDEWEAVGGAAARPEPFATFVADRLAERYLAAEGEGLSLYYYPSCPFCQRVLRAIARLRLEGAIELRDVLVDPSRRAELIAARGRATVPVLRCSSPAGDRWMPESRDIVRYLETRFG